jgi:hypothetical protein
MVWRQRKIQSELQALRLLVEDNASPEVEK